MREHVGGIHGMPITRARCTRFGSFVRIHKTLRATPAMEAGITDRFWTLEDVVNIVNEWEARQKAAI